MIGLEERPSLFAGFFVFTTATFITCALRCEKHRKVVI